MFDVRRSVGKTIEIRIEEDDDGNDGIYEQDIRASDCRYNWLCNDRQCFNCIVITHWLARELVMVSR